MTFADHFSLHAAQYAESRPRYPATLFAWLASQAPSCERAWDCATGNGQAAIALARHFAAVEATDASAAQIGAAEPVVGVRFSVCPAERTPFSDQDFDLVTVAQALHWFDHAPFFSEVDRVLKPGGLFAAWGYCWAEITPEIDAVCQRMLLEGLEPYWQPQNRLLWDGYRDLDLPFERVSSPTFAIEEEWTLPQWLAYVRSWSASQARRRAEGEGWLQQAHEALRSVWGEASLARRVRMPLVLRVHRKPG